MCFRAKETHQLAEANEEKNARLKAAFGLSDSYVDGSSFDPDRKAKEQAARAKEEAARALAMAQKSYRYIAIYVYSPALTITQ